MSYPVQPSTQLHDAKLVPVCNGHSPINQQHPSSSTHPRGRYSLQSISGETAYLTGAFKAWTSLCPRPFLHSVAESSYSSCCGARLHFPLQSFMFYAWISGTQLLLSWGGTESGLSLGRSTYRQAASESAHPDEMWFFCTEPQGRQGGGMVKRRGLAKGDSQAKTPWILCMCTVKIIQYETHIKVQQSNETWLKTKL